MLALALVALAVGLGNLAAAAAIGVSGVDRRLRWRIALIFGAFEAAMPVVGLLIGNAVSPQLGSASKVLAGLVLIVTGLFTLVGAVRSGDDARQPVTYSTARLLAVGAALSIANLAIGFALGSYQVNIAVAAIVIGLVCVSLSLAGLEIGARLGEHLGERSGLVSGAVLILIGLLITTGVL